MFTFSPLSKHQFPVLLHRVGAPLLLPFPLKPQFPLLIHRVGASLLLPFSLKHQFLLLLCRVLAPSYLPFPMKPQFPLLIYRVGAPEHLPFPLKPQLPLLLCRVGKPFHLPFPLSACRMFSDGRLERSCLFHTVSPGDAECGPCGGPQWALLCFPFLFPSCLPSSLLSILF